MYGRWLAQIVLAIIFLQTLYFKFSLHPDSVALFGQLGLGPAAIIGLGVIELIVGISLVIPKTYKYAAFASVGILGGAILSHIFILGYANSFILSIFGIICAGAIIILDLKV